MKGDAKVIEMLNEVLSIELTVINQYFLHAAMCEDWGYEKLHKADRKASIEDMKYAEDLIARILFLEGRPNMSRYLKINIGKGVADQFKSDLQFAVDALPPLREGIRLCNEVRDDGSRELLEKIVAWKEENIDWLESQLQVIDEVGVKKYLAQQF